MEIRTSFAVNGVTVDLGNELLTDASGGPVPLRRQCFAVLRQLSAQPDRLVTKEQLSAAVKGETGELIDVEGLRARAAEGWFQLLKVAGDEQGEDGAPLYVPSRVGLFLKLEREGYGADELRLIAEQEEWAVDNMYTVDDMAYVDDDLDTVIRLLKGDFLPPGAGTEPSPVVPSPEAIAAEAGAEGD